MEKIKVLFVCIHNSARSQMAEALLIKLGGERFHVESAGLEPGTLNPLAVEALKSEGIDISGHGTQSVFELFKSGTIFNYVITVCDESQSERCPIFPGVNGRLHWSFEDPSGFSGSWEEKVQKTLRVKDQIKGTIEGWLKTL